MRESPFEVQKARGHQAGPSFLSCWLHMSKFPSEEALVCLAALLMTSCLEGSRLEMGGEEVGKKILV